MYIMKMGFKNTSSYNGSFLLIFFRAIILNSMYNGQHMTNHVAFFLSGHCLQNKLCWQLGNRSGCNDFHVISCMAHVQYSNSCILLFSRKRKMLAVIHKQPWSEITQSQQLGLRSTLTWTFMLPPHCWKNLSDL